MLDRPQSHVYARHPCRHSLVRRQALPGFVGHGRHPRAHRQPRFHTSCDAQQLGLPCRLLMTVEYIRYIIEPSRAEAFVAAYTTAAVSLRESPHCQGYELTRCTEATESYVLRIVWDSEQGHLQGFRKSPQFKTFLAAIQPFVRDIEEMRHYEPTALHWSRSG